VKFPLFDVSTDGLARLTGDEQKWVMTTAFNLQIDPVNPGMQFHRIHRFEGNHFRSTRSEQHSSAGRSLSLSKSGQIAVRMIDLLGEDTVKVVRTMDISK